MSIDWKRLARTEMTVAAEKAKLDEWKERGLKEAEYMPMPDACPLCRSLAVKYPIDKCPVPVQHKAGGEVGESVTLVIDFV